jgi:hypothetical protein
VHASCRQLKLLLLGGGIDGLREDGGGREVLSHWVHLLLLVLLGYVSNKVF